MTKNECEILQSIVDEIQNSDNQIDLLIRLYDTVKLLLKKSK